MEEWLRCFVPFAKQSMVGKRRGWQRNSILFMARCRRENKRPVSHYPPSGPSLSFKAPLPTVASCWWSSLYLSCGPLGNTTDLIGGGCKGTHFWTETVVPLEKFLRLCLTKDVACIPYPCPDFLWQSLLLWELCYWLPTSGVQGLIQSPKFYVSAM